MIAIVNYGMGNLGSIHNMLKRIGVDAFITSNITEIEKAKKIILPGVGSFDHAVTNIKEMGLWDLLNYKAKEEKIPVLGICLGMQLLTKKSEEGQLEGFNWINAEVIKFKFDEINQHLKVPHMGWNQVIPQARNPLFKDISEELRFYFVHSYYVRCNYRENSIATTTYGFNFDAAIQNENIFGVQFHPEKSHKFGMQLLKNFSNI